MLAEPLFRPAAHGVYGPLDEIITLLPLVIGTALLLYLYFSARKAKRTAQDPAQPNLPSDDPNDL